MPGAIGRSVSSERWMMESKSSTSNHNNAVSIWLMVSIADGTVMMFDIETVQLKDELAAGD
jgi:hypothetical protein